MQISISSDKTYGFKPVKVQDQAHLVDLVTSNKWSSAVFKGGHRSLENFVSADSIALDIDNTESNVSINEATILFSEYRGLIVPTKSHQKPKHGKIADRYRVIIPFTETVTDPDLYYGTFEELYQKYPFIDKGCKDPSRYWEPSQGKAIALDGAPLKPRPRAIKKEAVIEAPSAFKGQLTAKTKDFLLFGAKAGVWNVTLHEAALDCRSQGYSETEAINLLKMATRVEIGNDGDLDERDLATISSAYSADEIYHEKRGAAKVFNFEKVSSIDVTRTPINWLVKDLLTAGGLSIIAGAPKSGKSTIIRQLAKCISRGEKFLDREVQRGKVLYLALEEQKEIVGEQLKALGVNDTDEFYLHCGPVMCENKNQALRSLIIQEKPDLLVIDTLILYADGKDINNYNDMYGVLTYFRELARESGTHIMMIHHQNKMEGSSALSIMGSSAIHGSVDAAIIFSNNKGKRYISSSQRGGRPFSNAPLIFDSTRQSYDINYDALEEIF